MAGLLPIGAGALGLGDAQTRSALNQPLAIEIPVVAAADGELAGLDVSLASPATFERYGLQPPSGLGELNFQVSPAAGGGTIRITSTEAVVEPFVTLLIEVRWPQGRLLREYTVLLDPPAFAAGAVQQPVRTPQAAAPVDTAIDRPTAATAPVSAEVVAGEQSHTVLSRETLWGIASRYRADASVDMNQVMMAIYRANPDAFAGNINRLRAGAVLRIPGADAQHISAGTADSEVQQQNAAWQSGVPDAVERGGQLQLVPPAEAPTVAAAAKTRPTAPGATDAQAALAESQRMLAVRDAELAALREQLQALQSKQELAAAAVEPPRAASSETIEPPSPTVKAEVAAEKQPAPARPSAPGTSWSDSLRDLIGSVWVWAALLAALAVALFVVRRRASAESERRWGPQLAGAAAAEGLAGIPIDDDEDLAEPPLRQQSGSGSAVERRTAAVGRTDLEEELPLERTISTEGPVNLDQSDPLAEADFHMAYGLYDQAADLLNQALAMSPERRDLRMKLLDVCFGWENREAFLSAAQGLHERITSEADPDWKRAVVMGQQLCPDHSLFAGAAFAATGDRHLSHAGDSDLEVDVPFIEEAAALDFDLAEAQSPQVAQPESESAQYTQPAWVAAGGGATLETPTIKTSAARTMETPTIEARAGGQGTVEIPTVNSPLGGYTAETPTVESWSRDFGGSARVATLQVPRQADERVDEIDLDNLGLDLSGLDDAAEDIATGLQQALSDDAEHIDLDLDAALGGSALDPTAEMAETDFADAGEPLERLTAAMEKSAATGGSVGDTAEQPAPKLGGVAAFAETVEDPDLADLGVSLASTAEMERPAPLADAAGSGARPVRQRAEDPTMTEVGTKLDLARAYLDMGDPDGARSILNEVIEEGDLAQRQEAQHILDTLGD
jgi:pilus assembly protein FimV